MRIFSRSSLVRIGCATSSRLWRRGALEAEQVRPRADHRDQRHHQLLADRIDRRVGDLGEVLLEIVVEQLGLVGQHGDRRVGAHRADRIVAGLRHRLQEELQVLLGVAEGLLAIEQRHGDLAAAWSWRGGRSRELDLGALQPFLVGLLAWRASFFISSSAMMRFCSRSISSILPGCSRHLRTIFSSGTGRHADLGGHHHDVVVGDDDSAPDAGRCGRAWRRSGGRR